jgi:hypothetical protein
VAGARPWPPPAETPLDDDIEILEDDEIEILMDDAEPMEPAAPVSDASSVPPGSDPDDDAETRGFFKKLFRG